MDLPIACFFHAYFNEEVLRHKSACIDPIDELKIDLVKNTRVIIALPVRI